MHDHHIVEGVDHAHLGPEHRAYLKSHCAEYPYEEICEHYTPAVGAYPFGETAVVHTGEDAEEVREALEDEIEDAEF